MKQIIQNLNSSDGIELLELPRPVIKPGYLIIQSKLSLVSLGTERMLVEFGQANLFEKARQKPDQVKQVINKIKSDGLLSTLDSVKTKLDQSIPLGYCNYGVVLESGVDEFKIGDRVASNGPHAEIIRIPEKLAVKVPDNVSGDEAVFTVIGSIGLQGIRLLKPTFGESVVVVGLGLVGLITAQLLKANGINVICTDVDEKKCALAKSLGLNSLNSLNVDPVKFVLNQTNGIGADGVIITAATKSNDVISQVAQMSRKKGRIILVGVVGLNINRSDFYEKELTFQVSCSYGPGRYDDSYEHKGIDYPLPYVRWTEKRNFEAILSSIENKTLNVKDLITEKVDFKDANKIYNNISKGDSIASIIVYKGSDSKKLDSKSIIINQGLFTGQKCTIGIIGAGNFTKMTILPKIKHFSDKIKYIASSSGISGTQLAKKYGISKSITDYNQILNDDEVNTVIIATRHNSHAKLVLESLKARKNVFVEKPLALNQKQLDEIILSIKKIKDPSLMVGFNRRFSPHLKSIKKSLGLESGPINIVATMNAGFIKKDHWVHDLETGGGRIIGEACHIIDVCVFLSGSLVESVCMNGLGISPQTSTDNGSLLIKFKNGSNASINYFSNGSKVYSKERVEVYSQERTWVVDNYMKTESYGVKGFKKIKTKIDKGHKTQFDDYINRIITGGKPLIPLEELLNVTKASFASIESLKTKKWVSV